MQDVIYNYFNGLKNEAATAQALEKAMFFANEALLTTAASLSQNRPIFYNPGTAVMKPKKDLAAVITVTTLIGFQVVALCALMWFILRAPTWTETLDADALAQIGGQLKEWGEPRPDLTQITGIVGAKLPYELSFEMRTTRVERPRLLEGEASGGLAGTGRWRLFEQDDATAVTYEWNVATTKACPDVQVVGLKGNGEQIVWPGRRAENARVEDQARTLQVIDRPESFGEALPRRADADRSDHGDLAAIRIEDSSDRHATLDGRYLRRREPYAAKEIGGGRRCTRGRPLDARIDQESHARPERQRPRVLGTPVTHSE